MGTVQKYRKEGDNHRFRAHDCDNVPRVWGDVKRLDVKYVSKVTEHGCNEDEEKSPEIESK